MKVRVKGAGFLAQALKGIRPQVAKAMDKALADTMTPQGIARYEAQAELTTAAERFATATREHAERPTLWKLKYKARCSTALEAAAIAWANAKGAK